MSNPLLDTLETRVSNAVDTIESLRSEINELREERKILEDKLQELINRMSGLDSSSEMNHSGMMSETEDSHMTSDHSITPPASPFGGSNTDY